MMDDISKVKNKKIHLKTLKNTILNKLKYMQRDLK